MYILKAFMVSQPLTDNRPGHISPIGELSSRSKTFSKEIGHYSKPTQPDVDLYSFLSNRDSELVVMPNDIRDINLEVCQWLTDSSINGNFNEDDSAFLGELLLEFSDRIQDVKVGQMVQGVGNEFLPEYVEFNIKDVETNWIKIWIADEAFKSQYDEYEIVVVPPLDNLDDLLGTPAQVGLKLGEIDDSQKQLRIQAAKDGKPDTLTKVNLYDWSNPLQPEVVLSTSWAVIIYGPAGDNVDSIRQALIDHILGNSAQGREVWEDYLPDIFKVTEFIIVPYWTNYAIDNQTTQRGILSPIVNHSSATALIELVAVDYPPLHVKDNLELTVTPYRSLALGVIGGPDNKDAKYSFYETFKDYIVLPTTSTEFSRMSPKTQTFVMKLNQMLMVADDMTEFSEIPIGLTRLMRDDLMFVATTYDTIQYLVASRNTVETLLGVN